MKKLFYLFVVVSMVFGTASCSKKEEAQKEKVQKWEYKIISEWGIDRGSFDSKALPLPEEELNKLGDEGWELVDVYTRIETVHPNFGNKEYVIGLQPNTRTEAVIYVLKRPKKEVNNDVNEVETTEIEEQVEVVEEIEEGPLPATEVE